KAIMEAFQVLRDHGSTPVAVRSSATVEDGDYASFAGQHDSYLNIVGVDSLLEAVRYCWASLWTDRAISYRARREFDHFKVHQAVIVQRMINSMTAGVLFTANPLTGRYDQSIIDASLGLGEAVV